MSIYPPSLAGDFFFKLCGVGPLDNRPSTTQVSMNPRPNIISYQVCMEEGGGKRGEFAGGSKYYQFWKFGDGRMRHLGLGMI